MKASEQLNKAADLIESGWAQGAHAKNSDGNCVAVTAPAACQYCALGAMGKAAAHSDRRSAHLARTLMPAMQAAVAKQMRKLLTEKQRTTIMQHKELTLSAKQASIIMQANDNKETTQADVVKAFRDAAKECEDAGN